MVFVWETFIIKTNNSTKVDIVATPPLPRQPQGQVSILRSPVFRPKQMTIMTNKIALIGLKIIGAAIERVVAYDKTIARPQF